MPEILLILLLAQSAGFQQGSEGACADLARLERIAIHAHEARYAYGERQFRLEVRDIETLSQGLSLGHVIPAGENSSFQKHQDSLEQYLRDHREAVRLYTSGNKPAAMQTLRAANTRSAWRARRDLTNFWSCHQEVGTAAYQNYRDRPRRADISVDKPQRIKKPKTKIPAWKITWMKVKAFTGSQKDRLVGSFNKALPENMQDERIGATILSTLLLIFLTLPFAWRLLRAGERGSRQPCHIPARLMAQSGNYQVTIIDIGRGGAKLRGGPQLLPKTPMRLIIGDQIHKGKAVWGNGQYSGISFSKRLSAQSLLDVLKADESVSIAQKKQKVWPYQLVA